MLYICHTAKAVTSSVIRHKCSFQSKGGYGTLFHSHVYMVLFLSEIILTCMMFLHSVQFSIKSFSVPELCIEMPETSTIGSLKVYYILTLSFQDHGPFKYKPLIWNLVWFVIVFILKSYFYRGQLWKS